MDKTFTDDEDVFKITESPLPNLISDTTEVVNISDDIDSVIVNEITEDSVVISTDEDSVVISDDVDNVNIKFSEILQSIVQNITNINNDNSVFIGTASEDMIANRMVIAKNSQIEYADNTDITHSQIVTGIITQSVLLGQEVNVTISGEVIEGTWNWTLDEPIFLDINGLMTQTVPTIGFSLQVGYPTSITSMIIDIKTSIILS